MNDSSSNSMEMMNVPQAVTAEAAVNVPELVQLHAPDGRTVYVDVREVDRWLTEGWSRSPLDAALLAAELPPLFREAERVWAEYVRGVVSDGYIDTSDVAQAAAAHAALNLLTRQCALVEHAIVSRYPARQGEGITMLRPDGVATQVDPGQVALHETGYGFTRA